MDAFGIQLTVFFQEPFWAGVFERTENGRLTACRVTFGAEPKDYDVLDYVMKNYYGLRFSAAVEAEARKKADNPKRRQREAQRQLLNTGISTKSQLALQMQREAMKTERKQLTREQREAEAQHRFELKREKKKQKKRGH